MSPKIDVYPELQNVTLSGNSAFAGIIKGRWGHTGFGVGPNPITGVFIRRGKFGHRDMHRGDTGKIHREIIEVMLLPAKEYQDCQQQ